MNAGLQYSANLSMLYGTLPVADRARAAASAGFAYVESWWPFDSDSLSPAGIDEFCGSLEEAGVQLVALNLDAGDVRAGQRGLLSLPSHEERVEASIEAVAEIVDRTGCRIVNALYGNRDASFAPAVQHSVALRRLVAVADELVDRGVWIVVETLNEIDSPAFPLTDIGVSAHVVREANVLSRRANVGLLLDTYQLATMDADPVAAIHEHAGLIRHVQFADAPGRGRPGTGAIDFAAVEQALLDIGYSGFVGLEYDPAQSSGQQREVWK